MRFITRRTGLTLGASALAVAACLAVSAPAVAADTANLQGHVASAHAGDQVVIVDTNTGQRITATVRADGAYVAVGLRPSNYHVTVGSDSQDITLAVGETSTLDLNAAAATTTTVTVTGSRRKEVRTAEVATSVSQTQMNSLPQLDRNFLNFAALAPGVVVSQDTNNKGFRAGATPGSQVNVFIDGQSQKNQVLQGGVAGQDSSRGNPFPQLAVQEFKVSTQNFKAEYEQAGTAIITAVTKTGGNEFHGSVFDEIETKGMTGQPYFERGNPKPDYHRQQYGLELGGPIIKNKLHFYVAYEGDDEVHPSAAVNMPKPLSGNNLGSNPALVTYLNGLNGSYPQPFNEKLFFGKLTYTPTEDDTIDFSIMNRTDNNPQGFGGTTAYSAGSNLDQFLRSGTLSWKHRFGDWLNEATIETQSYHWRQSNTSSMPSVSLNDAQVNNGCLTCSIADIGGPQYTQVKSQDNITYKDNLTYTGLNWHGDHVIKVGFKFASYRYNAAENLYQFFYDDRKYNPSGSNNVPVAALANIGNPSIETHNNQWGLFAQDDWTLDEHWQLNLGVRWDYEEDMLGNSYVTPAAVAAAIRGYTNFSKAGFNPEDYISDGHNRRPVKNMFAPRLGFSYDVDGDRRTVIFGGYGRYYDRTINDYIQIESRRAYAPQLSLQFCDPTTSASSGVSACSGAVTNGRDANGRVPWSTAFLTPGGVNLANLGNGEIFALNKNTKVPYNDQLDLGVRHRFGEVQASVTVSEIKGHNLFSWVLGNRNPDGSWCTYGPQYACQPWGYPLPGYGNFLISNDQGRSDYQAVYLQVEKTYSRTAHYGYTGTLTLTNAKSNGNSSEFVFDYASPTDTGMHPAPGVDKMRFVGTGIVDGPWQTQLSGTLTLASGQPFDLIDNSGPALRIIPSDLFPKNKLAYKNLDLRIAKDFTLPNGSVVTIDGEVYNVFDWVNRSYSGWTGGFKDASGGPSLKPDTATTGNPRTFQVGLRYKW